MIGGDPIGGAAKDLEPRQHQCQAEPAHQNDKGKALGPVLKALYGWGERYG
ncbi:MAG: hypothetical protein ABSG76_19780 [Xanthobacteraceae bacterium]